MNSFPGKNGNPSALVDAMIEFRSQKAAGRPSYVSIRRPT